MQWEMPGKRRDAGDVLGQQGNKPARSARRTSISCRTSIWRSGNALNDQVPNPFFGVITSRRAFRPHHLAPPVAAALSAVLRRLPACSASSRLSAIRSYNGATLQAERRLAQSLTFLLGYTWSKAIDDLNTPIDVYNRRLDPCAVGVRHAAPVHRQLGLPAAGRQGPNDGSRRPRERDPRRMEPERHRPRAERSAGRDQHSRRQHRARAAKIDNPTISRWFDTTVFRPAAAVHLRQHRPALARYPNRFHSQRRRGRGEEVPVHDQGSRDRACSSAPSATTSSTHRNSPLRTAR